MLKGNILTTDGWIYGSVEFANGRVTALEGARVDPKTNDAPYILPGFVDCHVHGGGGADIMEGGDAARPSRASMRSMAPPACLPPP